jgi:hypothetical protein
MADSARAAPGTDDRRRLADEPVLQVGQVRVNAGRPQLYSTQFTVTDRELRPRPIEDPARFSRVYRVLLQAARAEGFGSGRLPDFLGLEHGGELVLPGQGLASSGWMRRTALAGPALALVHGLYPGDRDRAALRDELCRQRLRRRQGSGPRIGVRQQPRRVPHREVPGRHLVQ